MSPVSLSAERASRYGHIHGGSEFSEHVWSSGSAGLQPGQRPNHWRDPTASVLSALYNHHIWSAGLFNHSASRRARRVWPWVQLRTPNSKSTEVPPANSIPTIPSCSLGSHQQLKRVKSQHTGLCIKRLNIKRYGSFIYFCKWSHEYSVLQPGYWDYRFS